MNSKKLTEHEGQGGGEGAGDGRSSLVDSIHVTQHEHHSIIFGTALDVTTK